MKKTINYIILLIALLGTQAVWAQDVDNGRDEVGSGGALSPLTFSKIISPDNIGTGSNTTLTYTITNPNADPVKNIDFTETLPTGISIANPSITTNSCSSGTLTVVDGGNTITYAGGQIAGGQSCTITVTITGNTANSYTLTSGDLTSDGGNSGVSSDDITVTDDKPGFSKSFSPSTISLGDRSTLTFTIDNGSNSNEILFINFTDNFPAGMVIASPTNFTTTCPLSPNTRPTSGADNFSIPNDATNSTTLPAGNNCTISIDVIANNVGILENTSEVLNYRNSLFQVFNSGIATANLTVTSTPLAISKTFIDDPTPASGEVIVEYTIRNRDRLNTVTGINFTDDLNAALAGLAPSGALPNDPCGTGSTLNWDGSVLTFSNGMLEPEGTCTFQVALTIPNGATLGDYSSPTSTINGMIGGSPTVGNSATDVLFVQTVPSMTKTFMPDIIGAGGTVNLQFSITNTSTTEEVTDLNFTDIIDGIFTVNTLPANGSCGSNSIFFNTTVNAEPAFQMIGGSIPAGQSCTFDVSLDVKTDAPANTYTNTTSPISGTINGQTLIALTGATDDLTVSAAPVLRKEFLNDPVDPGSTVDLQFTISNENNVAMTNIAFTDDLNAALAGLVATGLPVADGCGAGSNLSGTSNLSFTGGSLAANSECTFTVTLQVPSNAAPGTHTNTTSSITADVGAVSTTGNTSTDDLDISSLTLIKEFIAPVFAGEDAMLKFTLTNDHPTLDATDIIFTDNLGGMLSGASYNGGGQNDICGTGSQLGGTTFLFFTGGSVPAGQSCEFTIPITIPAGATPGDYTNVTSNVSFSMNGNNIVSAPAVNNLTVLNPADFITFTKSFTDAPVAEGGTVTVEYTITNTSTDKTFNNLNFTDDFDNVLTGLSAMGLPQNDICGTGSQISGTGVVSFTGGTLAPEASCTFSVTLQVPNAVPNQAIFPSSTSNLNGDLGGINIIEGPLATDDLEILFLNFSQSFSNASVQTGATTTLNFSVSNNSGNTLESINFNTNLDDFIAGATVSNLMQSGDCGTISILPDNSTITFLNSSMADGTSCNFSVTVTIPANAAPGNYTNTTSKLSYNRGFSVSAVEADLAVTIPPLFTKSFSPENIVVGGTSTLTFTINNMSSDVVATALDFTDNLPANVTIAATPNINNTCTDGTLTAIASTGTISYTGGTVAANSTCTIALDVTSDAAGNHVNLSGDLTSNLGNSGTATDVLNVFTQPDITTSNETICDGASIDLATLVTGASAPGNLSFGDMPGTYNLANSTVMPTTNTTYYVRDQVADGIFDEETIVITIGDVQLPVIANVPTNMMADTNDDDNGDCDVAVQWTHASVTDNCEVQSLTYELSGVTTKAATAINSFDGSTMVTETLNVGVTTITYRATDATNNAATTKSFTVTVSDNEAPIIGTVPSNMTADTDDDDTGDCDVQVSWSHPMLTENCPTPTPTFTYELSGATTKTATAVGNATMGTETFNVGTTTITYKAADASNNNATDKSFTVTVTDNETPVIGTVPSNMTTDTDDDDTGDCDVEVSWTHPALTENCPAPTFTYELSGVTTKAATAVGNANMGTETFNVGTTTITYKATDASSNNAINKSFTITVSDNENPVIGTVPSNMTANTDDDDTGDCDVEVSWTHPALTENCPAPTFTYELSGATTKTATAVGNATMGTESFNVGTTTITYKAADASSNNATNKSFTITVSDNENPVIGTVPNNMTANTDDDDTGDCDVELTWTHPALTENCPAPTFTYELSGATTKAATTVGNATMGTETFNVGTTTITYKAADASSNNATNKSFTITVSDNENPVIGTVPNNMTANTDDDDTGDCDVELTWTHPALTENCPAPTFTYELSGATTKAATAVGNATMGTETFNVGTTTITYKATDASSNNAINKSFTITVSDNENPVIGTVPSNMTANTDDDDTGDCDVELTWNHPSLSDNCTPQLLTYELSGVTNKTATNVSVFDGSTMGIETFNLGVTTITYRATDVNSNAATTKSFTVTVSDNEPPVIGITSHSISLNPNGTYTLTNSDLTSLGGNTTDNCNDFSQLSFSTLDNTTFDCDDLGDQTINLIATDTYNNESSPIVTTLTVLSPPSELTIGSSGNAIVETDGITTIELTVSRSNSICPISVDFSTVDGSAMQTDNDYEMQSGTLNFLAGEDSKIITIEIIGDTEAENDESFSVELSNPSVNVSIINPSFTITIIDDDTELVSLDFDGTNDQVQIPNFGLSSSFTIETWINYNGSQNPTEAIIAYQENGFFWGFQNGHLKVFGTGITLTDPLAIGVWQHIAMTYDENTEKVSVYVNGQLSRDRRESNFYTFITNATLRIGQGVGLPGMSGTLDEFKIWNYALSGSEINSQMNCYLNGNEDGLDLYFNFDNAIPNGDNTTKQTLTDLSNNEHVGDLIGFSLIGLSSNFLKGGPEVTEICEGSLDLDWITLSAEVIPQTSKHIDTAVNLNWAIANEINTSHFNIERSNNGVDFYSIGTVASMPTSVYSFTDKQPLAGTSFYRVQAIELDGRSLFSEIAKVRLAHANKVELFPNPTNDKIEFRTPEKIIYLEVFDALGQKVLATNTEEVLNSNILDLSDFQSGVYFIKIETATGMSVERVVKN